MKIRRGEPRRFAVCVLSRAGLETEERAESSSPTSAFFEYQLVVGRMLEANARPAFDWVPILKALVERYQNEVELTHWKPKV